MNTEFEVQLLEQIIELEAEIKKLTDAKANPIEPKMPKGYDYAYWEKRAHENEDESKYYQDELVKAHTLLGRTIHQLSERWDSANLTKYFPTDNLWRKRTAGNAKGEKR